VVAVTILNGSFAVAVPTGVVIVKGASTLLEKPLPISPTVYKMVVLLTTVKALAGIAPKLAAVVPVNSLPVIVTTDPTAPLVGVKEVMLGENL
jgi:hypothetical protein